MALKTDVPAQYVHPSTKQCNYSYTHPSAIQCNAATEINSLKSSVSSGKTQVANAITGKGVATSSSATFATMAANINSLKVATAAAQNLASNIVLSAFSSNSDIYSVEFVDRPTIYKWKGGSVNGTCGVTSYISGLSSRRYYIYVVLGSTTGVSTSYIIAQCPVYAGVSSSVLSSAYGGVTIVSQGAMIFNGAAVNSVTGPGSDGYYTVRCTAYFSLNTTYSKKTAYDGTYTISYSDTNQNDGTSRAWVLDLKTHRVNVNASVNGGRITYSPDVFFGKALFA